MIHFIVSFVFNIFIVLLLFLAILLAFLWAVGKQKASRQAYLNSTSPNTKQQQLQQQQQRRDLNVPSPSPNTYYQQQQQHRQQNVPLPPAVSPAVVPRRLSFSSSLTPLSSSHQQQFSNQIPKTPVMSTTPSRRVTFSLTPEQQQNEYDKQASANLARRRAPSLVSHPHNFSSYNSNDIPLVELFPNNSSNDNNSNINNNSSDYNQTQQQQPQKYDQIPPSIPHLSQGYYSQNPFMPTAPDVLRRPQQQRSNDNENIAPNNVRRRRPPPISMHKF